MTASLPDKKALRREMIARRDALAPAERVRLGALLMERVLALPELARARSVLTTMAIGSELDTAPLIARARSEGKTVILPRVGGTPKRLEIYAVDDPGRDLVPGVWDIPEPDPARCRRVALSEVDFALVPALAIDRRRYRLGYGAGFFDGLLAGRGAKPFCVTALPEAFHVDKLPSEAHDVPVDLVISEKS
jgi:5,10-methenyltetrahydrofolate synthetase